MASSPLVALGLWAWTKGRTPTIVGFHLFATVAANYLAFWLRFNCAVPQDEMALFVRLLPWLVIVRSLTFIPLRLYQSVWRYTSTHDLINIIGAAVSSTITLWLLVNVFLGIRGYPRSIYIIDPIMLICLLGGARLARRLLYDYERIDAESRVLIYGAGDAGEMIVRDMIRNPFYKLQPVGFIDDDPVKLGRRIHNVPVLGTRENIARIINTVRPDEILIAMVKVESAVIRRIVKALEPFKVPIKTLPNLKNLLDGVVTVTDVRPLALEDLLSRPAIKLDRQPLQDLICGRTILVTGAGGSIGSELCRQIAAHKPAKLILYERYENNLYSIEKDLRDAHSRCLLVPLVGDVTDAQRLEGVMAAHQPDLIFHAAAHKHVPLMEVNPCEAVKNNVTGTRIVAQAAHRHAVDQFILVSTDKAVNPSSVMGATKRVAEFIVQTLAARSTTRFAAVRFGNVLGSNGSVVPRFMDQIKRGGPVTVTHPHIRRFFMLIPEAVELLLHAAAMKDTSVMYILDMGAQINILDMARHLIRLSDLIPDEEVAIKFTGLRPGEKLFEELLEADETAEGSAAEKILRVRVKRLPDPTWLLDKIKTLEVLALQNDTQAVVESLRQIVPTFRSDRVAQEATEPAPSVAGPSREIAKELQSLLTPVAARLRS